MARDRKYFYPQVVLTCQDKILKELLEEDEDEEDERHRLSSVNQSLDNGGAIQTDDINIKIKQEERKENKALSQSIRQRFN